VAMDIDGTRQMRLKGAENKVGMNVAFNRRVLCAIFYL